RAVEGPRRRAGHRAGAARKRRGARGVLRIGRTEMNAVELTRELVKIDTINPVSPERPCAERVGKLLEDAGFAVSRHEFAPGRTSGALGTAGAMIVGEPTCNVPVVGHKGALWLRAVTRGVTAHGSMPEKGVNAVVKAARAVLALAAWKFDVAPDPLLGHPTLNVGTFQGGLNVNSVPDQAVIGVDIRTIPAQRHAELRKRLQDALGAAVERSLARIAEREPEVRAWQAVDANARGDGIPIGVKDLIDTADLPTSYGSPIYRGHRPSRDAACVAALKRAGQVILGKTVTTEFAVYSPGKTRNPHDPKRTPGGSSSGSAAAVAAGMVPAALGTQTAASIVRPASFCGCIGWKPTYGTFSMEGIHPLAPSLDTLGF